MKVARIPNINSPSPISFNSNGIKNDIDASSINNAFTNDYSDGNTDIIDVEPSKFDQDARENHDIEKNKETLKQWISYINATIGQIEAEKKKFIEEQYFKFNQEHFEDLYLDQVTGEYLTPEQYKHSEDALETYLLNNGYPINDHVDPNKYLEGVTAFNEYAVNEYAKLYSKYFNEITGITYEEYVSKINTYNSDINNLKSSKYSLEQQLKELPYLDLIETDAYKKFYQENSNLYQEISAIYNSGKYKIFNDSLYVDASCITGDYIYNGSDNAVTIDGKIYYKYQSPDDLKKDTQALDAYLVKHGYSTDPYYDPIAYNKGVEEFNNYIDKIFNSNFNYEFLYSMINTKDGAYLNEDEKKIYIYLLCNEGNDAAADYLVAIEDKINQRKGREEAEKFLASITDENGEINYNAWSVLLANGEGILMGIENFGEGLANIFNTKGMISDNQYAQMYILEALTNTSGAYINSLAQNILDEKGEEAATEFIQRIIDTTTGEINLEHAKEILSEEEYTKLEYKIKKDKETILDDSFQLGASFGNMVPAMALTIALSYCGAAPAATSLIGNVLMGLSAGGNSKNQALVSGNDLLSSTIYGLLSGTSETCLGLLLGNIPGLNETASLSFKGIFKEGMEEFLQVYVDAGLRCSCLGEEINLDELNQDAIKSFIYGVLMSFGTNAASMGVKLIINGKSVELNSMADVKAFFQILNDSGILIGNRTEDGVGKTIIIDESITNKSEMIDIMKSIYKDAEIFIKTADGNISYVGYSGYDVESDSSITTGDSVDQVGFQFFGRKKDNSVNSIIYNDLITGMEAHDAKYGPGSAINELYNYLYNGGDINRLSRASGFRQLVSSLSRSELETYYSNIVEIYNKTYSYRSTINSSSDTTIRNLEQEILMNIPNADYLTKARYLYLELSKRLSYDVNYFVGDDVLKNNIYNKNLNFENLDTNAVICKGWSELYAQLLIDAGFPASAVKICGSEKNGSHKWVEIAFNDYIIRCDATELFNHSTDLSNTKSGSSTNGFIALDKRYSGIKITDDMLKKIEIDSTWLRDIDQNLGYTTEGRYFNELSESLISEFYNPSLLEKVFGVKTDKLFEIKKDAILNYELPNNMKAIETKNFFESLKYMFFQGSDLEKIDVKIYFRQVSSDIYSGVVTVLEYSDNGIDCRIIDDYNGSFIIHFEDMYDYTNYLESISIVR